MKNTFIFNPSVCAQAQFWNNEMTKKREEFLVLCEKTFEQLLPSVSSMFYIFFFFLTRKVPDPSYPPESFLVDF